ncbi:MAG: polysaccharide deacetylase family protein [Planctomycetota bacterium]|jgi:peptidoglycan/xylan/chitin deacetylase (PgdA/CDA1 family)
MGTLFPILMYHQVVPSRQLPGDTHLYLTPERLQEQVHGIRRAGFELVTLDEGWRRVREGGSGKRFACLTFDDLYHHFYEHAWPVLKDLDAPATAFAIGRSIGGDPAQNIDDLGLRSVTSDQLQELAEGGVEIGSHTMNHAELTTLPTHAVREELTQSKALLEEILQRSVTSFCYPRGRYSPRILECVKEAGYDAACSTLRGTLQSAEDQFCLKRIRASMDRRGLRLYYTLTRFYDWLNRKRLLKDREAILREDRESA